LLVISFQSIPLGSNKNSVPYQKWPLARLSSTLRFSGCECTKMSTAAAQNHPRLVLRSGRVPSKKETATSIFFFLSPFVLVTGAKCSLD
jgi:hypothetical protein